ncbi:hypothetical protein [Kineococcus rubinsiae]|uniref:hypothetical protein n=1 Tax=Kineococcus rubinsiae TaxID=2609562 RepID=UPI001430EEC0|nr:hypothetical protein [Kineococcus rubinsiae]
MRGDEDARRAPQLFSARLAAAGADVVAAPMGPHPGLVRLVLDRFDAAVRDLGAQVPSAS